MIEDLNQLAIETLGDEKLALKDFSARSPDGSVTVYFKNIEMHLLRHIAEADIVVGCVAWLTSRPVLEALAKKKGVSIIVQKEDFLRPDVRVAKGWRDELRMLYNHLPSTLTWYDAGLEGTILHRVAYRRDLVVEAVRCVGNHNADKNPSFPRAHHKFVVFCRSAHGNDSNRLDHYDPYEVWTGSFNFTYDSVRSFENAVVLRDQTIVRAFFQEYAQIATLSEPLNWRSEWAAPQWRITR